MSFLDRFRIAQTIPAPVAPAAPVQRLVVPPRAFVNKQALDAAGLRRGMWVMSCHGLGIITGADLDGLATITLQKNDGTTRMELDEKDRAVPAVRLVTMNQMRIATIEEIPESRHEGADHLRSFGYINKSEA